VEAVWSNLKRSLANLTKQGIDQLVVLIKTRLKRMQYRSSLIDGFLAKTGLDLTFVTSTIEDLFRNMESGSPLPKDVTDSYGPAVIGG
jgi:hypothetical protein